MRDDMMCTKVTRITAPSSGNAAARRIALAATTTRFSVASLALAPGYDGVVFYAVGSSSVDCTGVATAQGFIMPGGKEAELRVQSGPYTHLSVYAGADFDVLVEEGVTTP